MLCFYAGVKSYILSLSCNLIGEIQMSLEIHKATAQAENIRLDSHGLEMIAVLVSNDNVDLFGWFDFGLLFSHLHL